MYTYMFAGSPSRAIRTNTVIKKIPRLGKPNGWAVSREQDPSDPSICDDIKIPKSHLNSQSCCKSKYIISKMSVMNRNMPLATSAVAPPSLLTQLGMAGTAAVITVCSRKYISVSSMSTCAYFRQM